MDDFNEKIENLINEEIEERVIKVINERRTKLIKNLVRLLNENDIALAMELSVNQVREALKGSVDIQDNTLKTCKNKEENSNIGIYFYKTGDVAKILGQTPAMIGYYCREFSGYLSLLHVPGKHRKFNNENVKKLQYIIKMMKDKRFTAKQTKEFLSVTSEKFFDKQNKNEMKIDLITKELKLSIEEAIKEQVYNYLWYNKN